MFDRNATELTDDTHELEVEAPEVRRAIENLDQMITSSIEDYTLENGSYIKTAALDTLNPNQRRRVLSHFVDQSYVRKKTQHRYKVVMDLSHDRLVVISV